MFIFGGEGQLEMKSYDGVSMGEGWEVGKSNRRR